MFDLRKINPISMSTEIIVVIFFFLFFIIIIGGIFLIAYIAAQSRKEKQKKILEILPAEAEFHAFVRFNCGSQQDKFLKLKAFQGSGILYVVRDEAVFRSTTRFEHSFDLRNSKIFWEGENLVNGLLKWFSIKDAYEKLYLNVETGMFIFHTGGKKLTTRSIYDQLLIKQSTLK